MDQSLGIGADQSIREVEEPGNAKRWRRSEQGGFASHSLGPFEPALSFPASEIERILKEYASECYAVGRGESMYYLVDDLPRIARAATQEILAIGPARTATKPSRRLPRSVSARPDTRLVFPGKPAHMATRAKSLVAVLPFIAILTVLALTIGLTFREVVGG